jgi:hypothetical protein
LTNAVCVEAFNYFQHVSAIDDFTVFQNSEVPNNYLIKIISPLFYSISSRNAHLTG